MQLTLALLVQDICVIVLLPDKQLCDYADDVVFKQTKAKEGETCIDISHPIKPNQTRVLKV